MLTGIQGSLFKFFTTELGWYDEFGPVKDALAHDLIEQIMPLPPRPARGCARVPSILDGRIASRRSLRHITVSLFPLFKFFTTELGWYDEFGPVKDALAHDLIEQIMQKPYLESNLHADAKSCEFHATLL
jgi:hypothetical protein